MRILNYCRHKDHRHLFGLICEYIVIASYFFSFYRILAHRHRNKLGEIDIIARRGKTITFVEVKGRARGLHEGVISTKQQHRLHRAAQLFLVRNRKYINCDLRFDLVVVNRFGMLQRIKNAF